MTHGLDEQPSDPVMERLWQDLPVSGSRALFYGPCMCSEGLSQRLLDYGASSTTCLVLVFIITSDSKRISI